MFKFVFLIVIMFSTSIFAIQERARVLVNIDAEASFSSEEFSESSSACLVNIDPRNPFKALFSVFLEHDFVVLSSPLEERMLLRLARRYGYRFTSFSKETLEVAVELADKLLQENPKCSSEIPPISQENAIAIYDLMKRVDKIFTENQINYWATGGTLIGAMSFHGVLPWDDDLDVCILESDEEKLEALKMEFEQNGLILYKKDSGFYSGFYKIFNANGVPIKGENGILPYHYPFVDVFVMALGMRREVEDIYVHKGIGFYYGFPHDYFTYQQIEEISRVPFGPLLMPVPMGAEAWIEKNYGIPSQPGFWKKYAAEPVWSHELESGLRASGAAFVEIDDFSPAPWE